MDGEEGHYLGDTEPYDGVILDLGLPVLDGVSVLEKWRRAGKKMPVLILTARDRWSDKVAGFDAGADDYVAKPFHMEEVLARVRALLRRSAGHATSELSCGPLMLDTKSARVTVNGTAVKLTSLEFRLLSYLMHHGGKVVSRTELVEHLYDQDFDRDSNTIEVFVGRLREARLTCSIPSAAWDTAYPSRTMETNSLSFRLIFTSAVVAFVLLVSAAFLLSTLFQAAIERNFDARLRAC
jgi:two-component system OmpR family response regulator